MKAHLRSVRISPKKTNVVAGLVRGKSVIEALDLLKFYPKKASKFLLKALASATANAEQNNGLKRENLKIKEILIHKGIEMRRYIPSTRGRALPLRKPTTHISITLEKK